MHNSQFGQRALLIIDMQEGLFNGPERPHEGDRVLANIKQLIGMAREGGIPIFAARHTGPMGSPIEPGSALVQLLPELGVDPETDTVFDKTRPSCFFGTNLVARLTELDVKELIIVGMKTEYCVDSTCRAAADLGFRATLIGDAHTSTDTPVLSARQIIQHHNRTLQGPFARVISTAEFEC